MKPFLLFSACGALFFVSCRRDNISPTGNARLTLIVDSFFHANTLDSLDSTFFTYDDAGRLAGWSKRSGTGTFFSGREYMITRDAQGRVAKVTDQYIEVQHGESVPLNPAIIHEVHYDGTSDQASFIYDYTDGNSPSSGDSTAITYAGTDVTDVKVYADLPATPNTTFSESAFAFDNSGRLLSSIANAEIPNSALVYAYAFDEKVNPVKFGVEGIFSDPNRMSAGNLLSTQQNLVGYGTIGVVSFDYTYRTDGRPLRAVSGGATPKTTTYLYSN